MLPPFIWTCLLPNRGSARRYDGALASDGLMPLMPRRSPFVSARLADTLGVRVDIHGIGPEEPDERDVEPLREVDRKRGRRTYGGNERERGADRFLHDLV